MDGVVHFEIPVDDADRAKAFYANGVRLADAGLSRHAVHDRHDHPDRRPDAAADHARAINGGLMNREQGDAHTRASRSASTRSKRP